MPRSSQRRRARAIGAVLAATGAALSGGVLALAVSGAGPALASTLGTASSSKTTTTSTAPSGATTGSTTTMTPDKLDAASDRVALGEYRAYLAALVAGEPSGREHAAVLALRVRNHCPGVLTSVAALPSDQIDPLALSDLGEEIGADIALEFLSDATAPFAQLSTQLGALTWSDPAPSRAVSALLDAEQTVLGLMPTKLCVDAHALASHPLSTPVATTTFVGSYLRASASLKDRLARFLAVLSNYATTSEAPVIGQIDKLALQFSVTSTAVEKSDAAVILSALGLTS